MSNAKTVQWLSRYKGNHNTKAPEEYVGTAYEVAPKYPTMYQRTLPGDIGWNHEANEHRFAATNKTTNLSTIADRRHNLHDGIGTSTSNMAVKHQFMRLPGKHSSDFMRAASGARGTPTHSGKVSTAPSVRGV
eukprot:CAMPEP_0114235708 /NCGR_PEP_ID=MMETSP0058-20121206/6401_1 /TAXON_ID=36894 /ORGANISM="Pyramimonas parkeae, CCMP726" /LENGTH=132 /DNA_ID=CAMNT_0001347501 /DNA_START=247 /DNA_END=645 /DNA_ORIENTATION=+